MERKLSSRKRPSSKAATPRRSTTSSTTGQPTPPASQPPPTTRKRRPTTKPVDPAPPSEPTPCLLTTTDDTPQLTRAQQTEYLRLLTLGASPAAACQKVGVSITAVLVTMDQSAAFRKRMDRVPDLLSQNVAASAGMPVAFRYSGGRVISSGTS